MPCDQLEISTTRRCQGAIAWPMGYIVSENVGMVSNVLAEQFEDVVEMAIEEEVEGGDKELGHGPWETP